jgi:Fic family protein
VICIHQRDDWRHFTWAADDISAQLVAARRKQGRLVDRREAFGIDLQAEALLQTLLKVS